MGVAYLPKVLFEYYAADRATGAEVTSFRKRASAVNFGVKNISLKDCSQIDQRAIKLVAGGLHDVKLLHELWYRGIAIGDYLLFPMPGDP